MCSSDLAEGIGPLALASIAAEVLPEDTCYVDETITHMPVMRAHLPLNGPQSFFRVTGGGKQAATASNPEGRVRAIIQPKSREKVPDAPPLPLKPATDVANPREPSPGAAR